MERNKTKTSGTLKAILFSPNTTLIMNWYFPVCLSTLSEVTLIFIRRSGIRVNFQVLFKSALNGAQTPSAAPAARMIARPVWRENYKSNTPGDLPSFHATSASATSCRNLPSKWNLRRRHLFVLLAAKDVDRLRRFVKLRYCTVNTQTCACNALLGRSHYNFSTPVTLTFCLVAAPKLNLCPPRQLISNSKPLVKSLQLKHTSTLVIIVIFFFFYFAQNSWILLTLESLLLLKYTHMWTHTHIHPCQM